MSKNIFFQRFLVRGLIELDLKTLSVYGRYGPAYLRTYLHTNGRTRRSESKTQLCFLKSTKKYFGENPKDKTLLSSVIFPLVIHL